MVVAVQQVPFVDLGRQHQEIARELIDACRRVTDRSSFTLGHEVEAFEKDFAAFVGTSEGIGVGSGTDALLLSLRAYGIGAGDEVVTAANTFVATAEAIALCGATPVFADVDEDTLLIDPAAVEAAITERTAAIIPVHLHGHCCDMNRLSEIAARHGVKVIEDACQAHGASFHERRAGSLGDVGCFSFYPSKNLGALGDGGFVTTDDPILAEKIRQLRAHGEDASRVHGEIGYTSRLDGMQAAFLRVKLPLLERWNSRRQQAAAAYKSELAGSSAILPATQAGSSHVHHVFAVRVRERNSVRVRLAEAGVHTAVHYPIPVHLEPAFAYLGGQPGQFPIAEKAAGELLSLPMFPYLHADEIAQVSDALLEALRQ